MKRFLVTIVACAVLALGLLGAASLAEAQPVSMSLLPTLLSAKTAAPPETALEQVRSQLLPQFESILSPEQRDRFKTEIVDAKASLRKAFKKIALSSDQKTKLAMVFKGLPKKDIFASLTPEQKQELFAKKAMFKPTPEAISEKINFKLQMAKDKGAMMPTSEAIGEKISAKMNMAKSKAAMPTYTEIVEKITAKMGMKSKMAK